MRFALLDTAEDFRAVETQWRLLEDRALAGNVYATFDWITMSWGQVPQLVSIATVWEGDRLVLGLPLRRTEHPDGASTFTGLAGALIQMVDALVDDDSDADAAIATLFAGLRSEGRGASLKLWDIPAGSPLGQQVPMSAAAVTGRTAQIDMPYGFEPYFAQRSRDLRSHHRRRMRQLKASVRVSDSRRWEADLDWFLATKQAWTPPTGEPMRAWVLSPVARGGLVALGHQWADDGRAVLTLLESGGEPVAGCLSFRLGAMATFYATTYAQSHARYSPGLTLLIETMRVLAAMGVTSVDLMQFRAAYKERMKTSTGILRSVTVDLASIRPMARRGSPFQLQRSE